MGIVHAPYWAAHNYCIIQQHPELRESAVREAEVQITCAYAGPLSEARVLHRSLFEVCMFSASNGDIEFISKLKQMWWNDEVDRHSRDRAAERLARKLVGSEKGWAFISKAAEQHTSAGQLILRGMLRRL